MTRVDCPILHGRFICLLRWLPGLLVSNYRKLSLRFDVAALAVIVVTVAAAVAF